MSTEHEEQLVKRVETMEDGRTIIYYTFTKKQEAK